MGKVFILPANSEPFLTVCAEATLLSALITDFSFATGRQDERNRPIHRAGNGSEGQPEIHQVLHFLVKVHHRRADPVRDNPPAQLENHPQDLQVSHVQEKVPGKRYVFSTFSLSHRVQSYTSVLVASGWLSYIRSTQNETLPVSALLQIY